MALVNTGAHDIMATNKNDTKEKKAFFVPMNEKIFLIMFLVLLVKVSKHRGNYLKLLSVSRKLNSVTHEKVTQENGSGQHAKNSWKKLIWWEMVEQRYAKGHKIVAAYFLGQKMEKLI